MYYISEFCRVCLQYEKPLVDIMKKEAEPETLINKLKLCVSEVEWSTNENILMCQTCIEKLNTAFEFKRQCLQSAQALESYITQLAGTEDSEENRVGGKVYVSVNRNEVKQELVDEYVKIQKEEEESHKPTAFIRVKSNQQLYPQLPNIILTANNTNQNTTFQNIFLNLIPSTAIKYPTAAPNLTIMNRVNNVNVNVKASSPVKDANQNMFLNINNTLHKIFPIVTQQSKDSKPSPPISIRTPDEVNISRILTESKTEELSVEIDPMCFDCSLEDDASSSEENTDIAKDWEELISSNKIGPETLEKNDTKSKLVPNISVPALTKISESNANSFNPPTPKIEGLSITPSRPFNNLPPPINNFVPIRPKVTKDLITAELEEKMMEFLNVDHFMAPKEKLERFSSESTTKSLMCEQCGQICDTQKALRYHIKQFHLGKFPYRCRYCSSVYALRSHYESHMQKHVMHTSDAFAKDTITLEDLSSQNEAILFPKSVVITSKPVVPGSDPTTPNISEPASTETIDENGVQFQFEHKCELCPRSFNSAHGLSRHKVRKHNQQTRRKYFVKGMKNAKCDICNREFSTQSYLQLHIKLHYRKNDYRLKVFNKDKYEQEKKEQEKNETSDNNAEESETQEVQEAQEIINTSEEKNPETKLNNGENTKECPVKEEKKVVKTKKEEKPSTKPVVKEKGSDEPKPLKGIKIKINLKNLKQSAKTEIDIKTKSDTEQNSDESDKEILTDASMTEDVNKTTMDVDYSKEEEDEEEEEDFVNGDLDNDKEAYNNTLEERISSDSSEASADMNMDCDESIEMSPIAELSEETESLKDEGSPEGRRPPIKIVLVDGKPQCTFCYKLFSRKHDLKRHVNNIHLKAIQYICHLCNSQFYEAFHLTRHLRQHNSFVRCTACMKDFSVLRDLKLHILAVHENSAPSQCGTCGQIFQKIKHLREHMHEHDKSIIYKCHICSDEFKESRELSKHLVGHSGMYSCNTCQTTFTNEHELNNHMKCHSDSGETIPDKRYECEICHNKYKKKRYLSAHMSNRHSADKQNVDVLINRVESEYDSS